MILRRHVITLSFETGQFVLIANGGPPEQPSITRNGQKFLVVTRHRTAISVWAGATMSRTT